MKQSQLILVIALVVVLGGGLVAYKERHIIKSMMGGSSQQASVEGTSTTPIPTVAAMEATSGASGASSSTSPEAMSANPTFTVTGSNFSFDVKEMKVKKGDKVSVTFKNAEGFHDWNLDEFNAHTQKLQAGKDETVTFVADKTGTFEYYCSVGKHRQMGMVGKLTVE